MDKKHLVLFTLWVTNITLAYTFLATILGSSAYRLEKTDEKPKIRIIFVYEYNVVAYVGVMLLFGSGSSPHKYGIDD